MSGTILGGFQTEIISDENKIPNPPSAKNVNIFYDSNDKLKIKKFDGSVLDLSNYALVQTVSGGLYSLVETNSKEIQNLLNEKESNLSNKIKELKDYSENLNKVVTDTMVKTDKVFEKDVTINGNLTFNGEIKGLIPPQIFVNDISAGSVRFVGGGNTVVSTISNTITISSGNYFGTLLTGQIDAIKGKDVFSIIHNKIEDDSYPIVSLVVPQSSVPLHVQGILNVKDNGFDVILSGMPFEDGYKINWQRASSGQLNVITNNIYCGKIEWTPGQINKGASITSPEILIPNVNFGDCVNWFCNGYSLENFQVTPFISEEGVCKITLTNISSSYKTLTSAIWGVRVTKN